MRASAIPWLSTGHPCIILVPAFPFRLADILLHAPPAPLRTRSGVSRSTCAHAARPPPAAPPPPRARGGLVEAKGGAARAPHPGPPAHADALCPSLPVGVAA